jgi:hypothetical protein
MKTVKLSQTDIEKVVSNVINEQQSESDILNLLILKDGKGNIHLVDVISGETVIVDKPN